MPNYRIVIIDNQDGEILREKEHAVLWEMSEQEIKCRVYKTKKWAQLKWQNRGNRIEVLVYKLN